VTSDNPRTEDPERILDDICRPLTPGTYDRIEDRRSAIIRAIELADPVQDVILLAGKGHETYQVTAGVKEPFDDRLVAREALAELARAREGSR
jgi:UDP-N-acetylmuramoyl-L-alanyl-D-glutamate--2,6-diaminopimelate ligase